MNLVKRAYVTAEDSPLRPVEDVLRDQQHEWAQQLMKFGSGLAKQVEDCSEAVKRQSIEFEGFRNLITELSKLSIAVSQQSLEIRTLREEISGGTGLTQLGYKGTILDHENRIQLLEDSRESSRQEDIRKTDRVARLAITAFGVGLTTLVTLIGKVIWDMVKGSK